MANLDRVLPFPVLPTLLVPPPLPLDDEQLLEEREGIAVAILVEVGAELPTGARRSGMELRFPRAVCVVAGRVTTREA